MIIESETCNLTMFEYLYITNHGCQIRRIRKYGEESSQFQWQSLEFIIKEFLQVNKNVLLYLSLLFCSHYGYCCRFHVIPRAEWMLEVRLSTSLFRKWKSHGIKMYDFYCGLPEYLDNRESVVSFFKTKH